LTREELEDEMKMLHSELSTIYAVKDSNFINSATVPVIKEKIKEYPHLKILALIFKKFLSLINMNIPYTGGLSSYSLIQMIIAVLNELKYSK
jgi:DNA polymerase sigma